MLGIASGQKRNTKRFQVLFLSSSNAAHISSFDVTKRYTRSSSGVDISFECANDANGHTIQKTVNAGAANETHTYYIYNAEERLIRIEDTNNTTIASYTYNPMGHRVSKTLNSQTTNSTTYYLYNHQGLVGEYNSAGTLIKEYHYMPDRTWMTEPLFQRVTEGASSQIYYYQNDHLGTPQRMINQSGATVWQANYNSFGKAHIQTNTIENNLRFPGQYYDAESGLHHNYFRDYDPELGRYLQSDPIGLAGGLNVYGYALQNPIMLLDPLGLHRLTDAQMDMIAGAAGGAVTGGISGGLAGAFAGGLVGGVLGYAGSGGDVPEGTGLGLIAGASGGVAGAVGGAVGGGLGAHSGGIGFAAPNAVGGAVGGFAGGMLGDTRQGKDSSWKGSGAQNALKNGWAGFVGGLLQDFILQYSKDTRSSDCEDYICEK